MFKNPVNLEALCEERVRAILEKDESAARRAGKTSFWKTFNENLEGVIKDADYRNTVFLHAVKSLQYATKNQPLAEATTSSSVATYNKAMLPTIITRVFPQIVATKFIATRQLDVPTQLIQTFRLSRNTTKGQTTAGDEFMDPANYQRYPSSAAQKTYQDSTKVIDPFYSSQKVFETGGTAAPSSATVTYAPFIAGTAVVYVFDSADPRNQKIVATDNGAGVLSGVNGGVGGTYTSPSGVFTYSISQTAADAAAAAPALTLAGTAIYKVEYQYNLERNKSLAEISFKQSTINAVAKSRKNFAQISAEAIQDLEAYTEGKLDALKELVGGMTESMALEIDLEIMMSMMSKAGKVTAYDADYAANTFRGTMFQKNQELIHKMNYLANDMSIDFLRGEGMFAITHPHIFTLLQNTNEFRMVDNDHKAQGNFEVGGERFGTVGNFTVAKAPQFPQSDKVLMGFTSKDLAKAPYAYFPFVTYLTPPSIDVLGGDIFSTVVGLQQRYDHQLLLDGDKGLGVLQVSNLYKTGVLG
jgi:hypothetical protein